MMLPTYHHYRRGQGLADYAWRPVTVTIPKRDWLQLMQVCQAQCGPDLAEWVAEFSETVLAAIRHAETPPPYATRPEPESDDLQDWLSTLIAHADQE
jgi:hypothetical protein